MIALILSGLLSKVSTNYVNAASCTHYLLTHLLRRHVERHRPDVDLLVGVDARHDEEEAGPLGAAGAKAAQPEHDGSLVLLDHLTSNVSLLFAAYVYS